MIGAGKLMTRFTTSMPFGRYWFLLAAGVDYWSVSFMH